MGMREIIGYEGVRKRGQFNHDENVEPADIISVFIGLGSLFRGPLIG